MRLGIRFAARSAVLTIWSAFFVWLLATGEVNRYIGPRTYWVIVVGAVMLPLITAAHFHFGRRAAPGGALQVQEGLGLAASLLPIVIVLLVPDPDLGALAASKKGAGSIAGSIGTIQPPTEVARGGKLTLEEVEYANQSSEYAEAVGIREGARVTLVGFVAHPKNIAEGTFALTRFAIFCCAADAVPYTARVIPPQTSAGFENDVWLQVKGTLAKDTDGFYVEASQIDTIPKPKDPYLK